MNEPRILLTEQPNECPNYGRLWAIKYGEGMWKRRKEEKTSPS